MPDPGLFEMMDTARALRVLKPDPVPNALVERLLHAATRASSAGNAQNWAFVVVRDAALRREVGALYRRASDVAAKVYAARDRPPHLTDRQWHGMLVAGAHLYAHMGEAPVLILPCLQPRDLPPADRFPPEVSLADEMTYLDRIRGASIYPAVQNIVLACRALGLGTVITTNHLRLEAEMKALLGIPTAVDTFALMPVGWPVGKPGPLSRKPLAEAAHRDRWGKPWAP